MSIWWESTRFQLRQEQDTLLSLSQLINKDGRCSGLWKRRSTRQDYKAWHLPGDYPANMHSRWARRQSVARAIQVNFLPFHHTKSCLENYLMKGQAFILCPANSREDKLPHLLKKQSLFFVYVWAIPSDTQRLFLAMRSAITPGRLREPDGTPGI